MNRKILIVEDDTTFGTILLQWFLQNNYDAVLVAGVAQAKKRFAKDFFELVLTDLRLPDGDGIMLLTWLKEKREEIPVIIMTSYAEIESAVSAIRLGAFDYLEKPINPAILEQKIGQAMSTSAQFLPSETKKEIRHSTFVQGNSSRMLQMTEHINLVAPTKMSVFILGENGTGKEYVARLIHERSPRKNALFMAVDCGSLSKELAPSELFGHLKGSFTSAISDKKGVFEEAHGGTVLLDEVGNLPYEVQVQLLRTLQEQKIRPVGAVADVRIDIRIIAATNENIKEAVAKGKFREDLFHRLNEFSITVPPLRERPEDIEIFARHFLKEANEELGKKVKDISSETLQILRKYSWTGNLRELRNVMRRATLFAQTEEIIPENLPVMQLLSTKIEEEEVFVLNEDHEKEQIEKALKRAAGNKTVAARLLKIDRKTLYNKMHRYGIIEH
ncbi:sigma-54 dependent transcriptional regulator [Bacteroidales bacterium OttesenSCG-928-L19]|nr:sigma-54 dependent transcriptional regulator [Bacteroidales bacterium OttesenSCG-928-L19]